MKENRKIWKTPELIIIAKGTPEENVLQHCKTMNPNHPVSGPADPVSQDTCASGDETNCSNCSSRGMGGS